MQQKIEKFLSSTRLGGYKTNFAKLKSSDHIVLYKWNTALSESIYPLLQTIEVAFRNALYNSAAAHFNQQDWLLDSKLLHVMDRNKIDKVVTQLKIEKPGFKTGDLIAALSFGFWTRLLDRRYEQLLWPQLLKTTFAGMPKKQRTIRNVAKRFDQVRRLRNRTFHHEPIWHWQDLTMQHDAIIEAISWIEPALLALVNIDRFSEIYQAGPKS